MSRTWGTTFLEPEFGWAETFDETANAMLVPEIGCEVVHAAAQNMKALQAANLLCQTVGTWHCLRIQTDPSVVPGTRSGVMYAGARMVKGRLVAIPPYQTVEM